MILQSIKKELVIVFSDLHSLAVLFLMPLAFMIIMTVAMSGRQADILDSVSLMVEPNSAGQAETLYLKYLDNLGYGLTPDPTQASAIISFDQHFGENILANNTQSILAIEYQSRSSLPLQALINQHLQLAFARVKLHLYMLDTEELDNTLPIQQQMDLIIQQTATAQLIDSTQESKLVPTVAISIPSWLVFGIFLSCYRFRLP
ncbi:hypothetical protein RS130_02985 [Paraglaciecola aquimarina]|uniref:ABC transporter permease n=1 Tax=Paraglaciecola aquimarina TaxID=1235557 RepID=A0ABU3SSN9_9ALTE|nr:hypothetical protein [Paraglaciecola aquimarina]MDU0353036.1 hypothetical protein [Paraglaciecola aquimarina]